MVKGVSRQVIVVQCPDKKLFEQAIFILTEEAVASGVTDEMLLKQANAAIRCTKRKPRKSRSFLPAPVWAGAGAALTGLVWLISSLL